MDTEISALNVLVVEDIALNQLLMKTLLDDFGFTCEIASNGKQAIEKLAQNDKFGDPMKFDIILMDLQMPEMNGFETTEYIRNVLRSNIPIIALTADVTTADLSKCKAVGMNDYISKPVDDRLLFSKMVAILKSQQNIVDTELKILENGMDRKLKCINLAYLMNRTKADPKLMQEMISLYLIQTPPLIQELKKSAK